MNLLYDGEFFVGEAHKKLPTGLRWSVRNQPGTKRRMKRRGLKSPPQYLKAPGGEYTAGARFPSPCDVPIARGFHELSPGLQPRAAKHFTGAKILYCIFRQRLI